MEIKFYSKARTLAALNEQLKTAKIALAVLFFSRRLGGKKVADYFLC